MHAQSVVLGLIRDENAVVYKQRRGFEHTPITTVDPHRRAWGAQPRGRELLFGVLGAA